MTFPHHFNPVKLLKSLVNERYLYRPTILIALPSLTGNGSEESVAQTLKLPFQPEKSGWSWADLGLLGVHNYAARRATKLHRSPECLSTQPSPSPLSETESRFSTASSLAPQEIFSSFEEDSPSAADYRQTNFLKPMPTVSYTSRMPSEIISSSRVHSSHQGKGRSDKRVAKSLTSQPYSYQSSDLYGQPPHSEQQSYFGAPEQWPTQTQVRDLPPEGWASPYSSAPSQVYCGTSTSPGSNSFMGALAR